MTNQMVKSAAAITEQPYFSPQYDGERFVNTSAIGSFSAGKLLGMIKVYFFDKQNPAVPDKPIPVITITSEQLAYLNPDEPTFFRLGHSSILLWLDGNYWLIDPVFSERASPFSFAGPKRFHQPPIDIEDLPAIKGVIISHNHYDHLDKSAIQSLTGKTEAFYVPLGVGADLAKWGVESNRINELDWWQGIDAGSVRLTATPAQHFSGRGIDDKDSTLWSSWVIEGRQSRVFFSGDSGYFDGFKEIGRRYGPFDVSFVETGAYNKLWPDVHMQPSESIQTFKDLNSAMMIPIHNGTFDLGLHTWFDPFEQMVKLSLEQDIPWRSPRAGKPVVIGDWPELDFWWREAI